MAAIVNFFLRFWHQIVVIALSCVPVIESRYAIVICRPLFQEISTVEMIILTQLGAFFTAFMLLVFLRKIMNWMKTTKLFHRLAESVERLGEKKSQKLKGKLESASGHRARVWASVIGVFVFVALPIPGTGVWTGCLVATLLNIRFKYAFPAVALGSITATGIMLLLSNIFFQGVALW